MATTTLALDRAVGQRLRRLLVPVILLVPFFVALLDPAPAYATSFVPYQFIAKTYTEGLGRAPDQSGWSAEASYFTSQGCSASTLAGQANTILTSSEFNGLGYSNPALVEVAYRTLLNREPDPSGYANWLATLNGGTSFASMLTTFEGSAEFAMLAGTICSTSDYGFGTTPALSLSPTGSGYTGSEAGLQSLLNAAASGATVYLARRATIALTATLTIPAGVTLATTGAPGVQTYAEMGRLARQPGWTGESVSVQAGATLTHVWVDGDRPIESSFNANRFNIRTYGGSGTTISYDRIGNTAGATNLELHGAKNGTPCSNTVITYNLVDAYSSQHGSSLSDGISDGCEGSSVTHNSVLDASDVGIILFGGTSAVAQQSQVTNNTVIQAGHGSFALLGVDPSTGEPTGSTISFNGSTMSNNTIWTSPTGGISTFGITDGTYAWFGGTAAIGTNSIVENNTAGSLSVYSNTGIDISGMLNTTVTGNTLNWVSAQDPTGTTCPKWNIGASVSSGWASGIFPGYTDAVYSSCVCQCVANAAAAAAPTQVASEAARPEPAVAGPRRTA